MKYEEMCRGIAASVGGADNIKDCYHCLTRLRMELKDQSKADLEALEKIKGVLKVNVVGAQIQCIIGQHVVDVYDEFCALFNIEKRAAIDEDVSVVKEKKKLTPKNIFGTVVEYISACVQPWIIAIICGSMFKMLVSVLGPTMLGVIVEGSDIYTLLTFVGDAPFYFLPVMIAYTASKKFGCSTTVAVIMGAILLHPTLTTIISSGVPFTVFGIPMSESIYSSSIIPIILIVWVMTYVEKFFNKIIPPMFNMMLVPLLTVLVMLPIGLCVLGPLGTIVGGALSGFFLWIAETLGAFGIACICAVMPLLVLTGMHLPVGMISLMTFMEAGHEGVIMIGSSLLNCASLGVSLAFLVKSKSKENRTLGFSSFVSQALGGVSEPTLYGIALRYKKPLYGMMGGAFVGGLVAGLLHVAVYTMVGASNVMLVAAFLGGPKNNFLYGCISCGVALVSAFILTYIMGFSEE